MHDKTLVCGNLGLERVGIFAWNKGFFPLILLIDIFSQCNKQRCDSFCVVFLGTLANIHVLPAPEKNICLLKYSIINTIVFVVSVGIAFLCYLFIIYYIVVLCTCMSKRYFCWHGENMLLAFPFLE